MLEEMEKEKEERDRVRQRNRAARIQANEKNEKTKDDKAEQAIPKKEEIKIDPGVKNHDVLIELRKRQEDLKQIQEQQ